MFYWQLPQSMSNKRNKIIIITTSFPYGNKEPLIPNELKALRQNYDEISVVSFEKKNSKINSTLNSNESSYSYDQTISTFQKVVGLLFINWKLVFSEFKNIKKNYEQRLNFPIIKMALMSMIKANNFQRFIKKEFYEDLKTKNITFYSWWCTDEFIGLLHVKKEKPEVKVYTRIHAYDLYFERHTPSYLPFRNLIISKANGVFVISKQGFDYLQNKLGKPLKSLSISRLGSINNLKPKEPQKNNTFRIVSCSVLIPLKRIDLIIKSLSELKNDMKINWIHFGEGPEMNQLKKQANNLLSPFHNIKYEFYGPISNPELHDFYSANQVDLFINVSSTEGVPISIMEALSYGIPCVGTDVGGVSELIYPNHNGFLLDVNFKPSDLSQIILDVHSQTDEMRTLIRQNSYQHWNKNYNAIVNNSELIRKMLS